MKTLVFWGLGWAIVVVALARPARADALAQDETQLTPRPNWIADGIVTVAAAGGWLVLVAKQDDLARPSCPCEPREVAGFERGAIDNRFRWGEPLSNATVAFALTLGASLTVFDNPHAVSNLFLVVESTLVAGFLTQAGKLVVSRPYPYMYRERDPERIADGVNYASFWSGHTVAPMTALSTTAALFAKRNPGSPWRYVVWALAPVLAVTAGVLQLSTANHFPTDIGAAVVIGGAVGTLNVWGRDLIW